MKLTKKFLSGLLCMIMVISLAACGGSDNSGTANNSQTEGAAAGQTAEGSDTNQAAAVSDEELEPMEISIAIWGIQDAFDNANAETDTIFNDLCEKFNITIKPVGVTWNDWQEKNKVWAASGSLPDVFCDANSSGNLGLYITWAEQGVIKAIPSDLSAYPNLEQVFGWEAVKPLAINGTYYLVPRGNVYVSDSASSQGVSSMGRSIIYRKDWAEAAGYTEAPTTFDALVEMTKAMMEQHPGAVGIAVNNPDYMQAFATDIYPEICSYSAWTFDEEQWKPTFASEKTTAYIERLQKLYKDGILDPDFIIQKDGDGIGKFHSGNACVMLSNNIDPQVFMNANQDVENIEDAIGFVLPFLAADGNYYVSAPGGYWSETYISAQVDDAKTERILMLLDYMYSYEYTSLVQNGIEGVDWEKTDKGNVSLLTDMTLEDKYPVTQTIGWLSSWQGGFSADKVTNAIPVIAAYEKLYNEIDAIEKEMSLTGKPLATSFYIELMDNQEKIDVSGLTADFTAALNNIIISNEDPVTAWETMIKDFNAKGLNEAIESVTQQALDEGIVQ